MRCALPLPPQGRCLALLCAAAALLLAAPAAAQSNNFNADITDINVASSITFPPLPAPTPSPSPPPAPGPLPVPVPIPPGPQTPIIDAATAAAAAGCVTPADLLAARGGVNVFLNAMEVAGLSAVLTSRSAVQTIFAPTEAAFVAFLRSQGIRESQMLAQRDKLRALLQNHVLPNVQVRAAQMAPGAAWPTLNPAEALSVAAPVGGALAAANLTACNSLVHEVNVVLVPPGVLPMGPGAGPVAVAAAVAGQGGPPLPPRAHPRLPVFKEGPFGDGGDEGGAAQAPYEYDGYDGYDDEQDPSEIPVPVLLQGPPPAPVPAPKGGVGPLPSFSSTIDVTIIDVNSNFGK